MISTSDEQRQSNCIENDRLSLIPSLPKLSIENKTCRKSYICIDERLLQGMHILGYATIGIMHKRKLSQRTEKTTA